MGEYFYSLSLHRDFFNINTAIKFLSTLQPSSLLQPHLKKQNNRTIAYYTDAKHNLVKKTSLHYPYFLSHHNKSKNVMEGKGSYKLPFYSFKIAINLDGIDIYILIYTSK